MYELEKHFTDFKELKKHKRHELIDSSSFL